MNNINVNRASTSFNPAVAATPILTLGVTPENITGDTKKITDDIANIQAKISQAAADFKSGKMTGAEFKDFMDGVFDDIKNLAVDTGKLGGDLFDALDSIHKFIDQLGLPAAATKSLDALFTKLAGAKDAIGGDIGKFNSLIDNLKATMDNAFQKGQVNADKICAALDELNAALENISQQLNAAIKALDELKAKLAGHPQAENVVAKVETAAKAVVNVINTTETAIHNAKAGIQKFFGK